MNRGEGAMWNRDDEAQQLATAHYGIEAGIRQIFRILTRPDIEAKSDEPIKLLEVNENTIAAGIMPLQFGPVPAKGFHFPTIIVEVTPEEFDRICARELPLPSDWTVGPLLPNPAAAAVA
jgi:hypothetical protein